MRRGNANYILYLLGILISSLYSSTCVINRSLFDSNELVINKFSDITKSIE